MNFPGRNQRRDDSYGGVSRGMEITADAPRAGIIDDGLIAFPERIVEARRQWPQAQASDFEQIGKRLYRDKGTGAEYRHEPGCPLLGVGSPGSAGLACFFISGGRMIFLRRADVPEGSTVWHGPVIAREVQTR